LIRVLSLGAGVQSSTLALMIAAGQEEPIDFAVFADTGDEPEEVYSWLEWLTKQLPFPVHIVSDGRLSDVSTALRLSKKSGNTYLRSSIPAYILRSDGGKGMAMRQCTANHKITPINKFIKKMAGVPRGCKETRVTTLLGISLDEYQRMKPSKLPWIVHAWPLIDRRMTRKDCLTWMERMGYPHPPRSACIFCPYKSDSEWIRLKTNQPKEFTKAVEYERRLKSAYSDSTALTGTPYLHSSLVDLDKAEFSKNTEKQVDMFNNECEGMCGV
jgi:hypothetical protein